MASPDQISLGLLGRVRLTGTGTHAGPFVAVQAIGTATYGAGCVAERGEAPTNGDTIPETPDVWPALTVVLASGEAWGYLGG